jgi:4-aminobutyrate aminotransferase-like enzyme
VQEQAAKFFHTDFTIVPYELYVTLSERLVATAPISGPVKAAFFNAGTEAVENAVKFARAYTKRPAVIGFEGGFHGRTLLSLTLTSKTHPYKAGLGPFAPEVYRLPFAQDYRGPSAADALAALERAVRAASSSRRRSSWKACAASATTTASCSSSTKSRRATAGRERCGGSSTTTSSPT